MKPKIIAIIGARPQFIKHFPFEIACEDRIDLITIHTGQHYDENMSAVFFQRLNMKRPNYMLNIGSKGHGEQTGLMMVEIEKIFEEENPDGAVVYGDTNSTLAGALVASKLHIPIFHIEAGLRSYNREMPEEINRVLTDVISDLLFVPSDVAIKNLNKEGINKKIFNVGDIMKDVVNFFVKGNRLKNHISNGSYYYATIHRPYNTDEKERLLYVLSMINELNNKVVFSLHPRTRNLAERYGINTEEFSNIEFIKPQSYVDNLSLLKYSQGLITDSGGMQKEAYWLEKKCITIRKETEWKETILCDANTLLFEDLSGMQQYFENQNKVKWNSELYGDSNTAHKIVDQILKLYS